MMRFWILGLFSFLLMTNNNGFNDCITIDSIAKKFTPTRVPRHRVLGLNLHLQSCRTKTKPEYGKKKKTMQTHLQEGFMLDFALNQAAKPRTPTFRSLFLLPICGGFASFPKNHNRGLKPGLTSSW